MKRIAPSVNVISHTAQCPMVIAPYAGDISRPLLLIVVVTAGDDDQIVSIDALDQPVGVVDAARPETRKTFSQWFRLANAAEGLAHAVLNQAIDTLQSLAILALPVLIILPGSLCPGDVARRLSENSDRSEGEAG